MSTVVAPGPVVGPPSNTRSTRPSMIPNTSIPAQQVGLPEILALVETSGCVSLSSNALATREVDCRIASLPVFPVTFSGTRDDPGTMIVNGPGQNLRA